MTKKCVIFDLDGTLADTRHRLHYLQESPKNWPAFFDACAEDPPCEYVVELFKMALSHYPVFIFSGRPDSHRAVTVWWLDKFQVCCDLVMRKAGDHRPDTVVKKEMLDRIRADGYEPLFAVEDRPEVVEMWRQNNVPCLVVDQAPWVPQIQRDAVLAAVKHLDIHFGDSTDSQMSRVEEELIKFAETFK